MAASRYSRITPEAKPTAPWPGPYGARQVEGLPRVWEVYSRAGGNPGVVVRLDFTGVNVNARSSAAWIADALCAKWNTEQSVAAIAAAFKRG
jgi:hypothetical protein